MRNRAGMAGAGSANRDTTQKEEHMMRSTIGVLKTLLILGASAPLAAALAAQSFPAKPVEVVVHTNPGGGADLFGRFVVDIVNREKLLPQPMVVVNKPGGSHAVAANHVASKRGDPHAVLTIAHSSFLAVPTVSGLDLGLDKFVPLVLYGLDAHTVAVRAESPFKSVKDVIEAAKKAPKSLNVGIGTMGGTGHLVGYLLEKQSGARFNFIGLKGGGEAVVGTLGGHYQLCFENISEIMEHVNAKKLRVLALPTEKRLPYLPDVPTLKELGYPIVGGLGRGFVAPAGIPKDARAALESAFDKAHKSKAWQEFAKKNMFDDTYLRGPQFEKWLKAELAVLQPFIQDIGVAKKK
jgi:putative tricarboxylic transport membrane protein